MDEQLLEKIAEDMLVQERTMKKRLEELRKLSRTPSKAWPDNLALVSQDVNEKRSWVSTIEADVVAQKSIKKSKPSDLFFNGPSTTPNTSLVLLRVLAEASKKAQVSIPRAFALDLEKSGLGQRYRELCVAEEE